MFSGETLFVGDERAAHISLPTKVLIHSSGKLYRPGNYVANIFFQVRKSAKMAQIISMSIVATKPIIGLIILDVLTKVYFQSSADNMKEFNVTGEVMICENRYFSNFCPECRS